MKTAYEKSVSGRPGSSLPACDVPAGDGIPDSLRREHGPRLPELSELETLRHFVALSRRNMGVDTNFYPLGSCTMKYNPKFCERIASMPGFTDVHPLLPQLRHGGALTQGSLCVLYETEQLLCELLGFRAFTMQPLAGAHGELTGIMLIAAYHRDRGSKRNIMLIPDAAHGTNPASAALGGFETRTIPSDDEGDVDLDALRNALDSNVAGLMLTCPNTVGLYDPNVREICRLVHEAGGLVYADGANLNAILGRVRPGDLGFDVIHVNLHKTFATPHGGGGPGAGPVGVARPLIPYLPKSRVMKRKDGTYALDYDHPKSIGYIAPFYGNFGIILRAYAYLLHLGREGVRRVSETAVLNANYLLARIRNAYHVPFDRACMHECVVSADPLKTHGIQGLDVAKALLDKGFHPPTMYFPQIVSEALMIEPSETESKEVIDAFADALLEIAELAERDPDAVRSAPQTTPVLRVDETRAARNPDLAEPES